MDNPTADKTQIHATIDFDRAGKQHGHLCVPYSYNLGGWASVMVPVTVVSRGEGPTALVLAGNHGDEYPGQVGQIHFLERPDREPVPVNAVTAGILLATRGPALVAQGDCVACIAHLVDIAGLR